jgi:hypothetical protein
MDKIVQTLQSELAELEAEIRTLNRKVQGIKDLLAVYEMPRAPKPNGQATPPSNLTKNERMENAIVQLLETNGEMHRRAILDHLTAQGIMGGEKDPIGHLASFLSNRRKLFVSDGHGKFRLV